MEQGKVCYLDIVDQVEKERAKLRAIQGYFHECRPVERAVLDPG